MEVFNLIAYLLAFLFLIQFLPKGQIDKDRESSRAFYEELGRKYYAAVHEKRIDDSVYKLIDDL